MAMHSRSRSQRSPLTIVLIVILVLAAFGIGYAVGTNNNNDEDQGVSSGSTSSTSSSLGSSSTSAPLNVDISSAVWPFVESTTRYTDPVDAARGFAIEFVGFVDPEIGEFQQGDSRSGEVEIRTKISEPTTVIVRKLSDDTWWVLGSATANIVVESPATGALVTSPQPLSGKARAFEGTVDVEVRQDGSKQALGKGFVTGSGGAQLGPFEGEITFSNPTEQYGTLLFTTTSAEDGKINEAGAMRVRFR